MTVYMIGSTELQQVKIGYTSAARVEDRMADLQTGSPFPLKILATSPGGKDLEKLAHNTFAEYRRHGEWFDFGGQDPVVLFRDFVRESAVLAHQAEESRTLADDLFDLPPGSHVPPVFRAVEPDVRVTTDMGDTVPVPAPVSSGPRTQSPYRSARTKSRELREKARRIRAAVDKELIRAGEPFGPFAKRWRDAAKAREELRTPENLSKVRSTTRARRDALRALRTDQKNLERAREEAREEMLGGLFNQERRFARATVRDSKALAREAAADHREARKNYPLSLPQMAARCHLAHMAPTALWATVSDSYASTGCFSLSVAAVALNAVGIKLGNRYLASQGPDLVDGLVPTGEEADLLKRLEPKEWCRLAEPRGLQAVVSAGGRLTSSGIQVKLTLNGTMDLPKLKAMTPQLRAALRLKEGVRLELRDGATGGHARLTLRTRSAASSTSLEGWKPGDPWAVNTVTGEPVHVPLGRRMLVAGTSGSGKSWSTRPVLAEASAYEDHVLIVIDPKRVEARCWQHRARVAVTADEILAVTDELVAEMWDRLDVIPRGQDKIKVSARYPRITVFVDEGSVTLSLAEDKGKGEDKIEYSRILSNLVLIAQMGRSPEINLIWATQKPTVTGKNPGLDSQIDGQLNVRACLAVANATDSRTVFGEDATKDGWEAHKLPMPGVALLMDGPSTKPEHLRTRAFSPQDIIDLPDHVIWSRSGSPGSKEDAEGSTPVRPKKAQIAAVDRDDMILAELSEDPCRSLSSLARATGAGKAAVQASLERLEADGIVERDEDGCWNPVG